MADPMAVRTAASKVDQSALYSAVWSVEAKGDMMAERSVQRLVVKTAELKVELLVVYLADHSVVLTADPMAARTAASKVDAMVDAMVG